VNGEWPALSKHLARRTGDWWNSARGLHRRRGVATPGPSLRRTRGRSTESEGRCIPGAVAQRLSTPQKGGSCDALKDATPRGPRVYRIPKR
jgi:hypothetical protein